MAIDHNKVDKNEIDLADPLEMRHHARFEPSGVTIHVSATDAATGEETLAQTEVTGFATVDIELGNPQDNPAFAFLPKEVQAKVMSQYDAIPKPRVTSAREAAAIALGLRKK